MYITGISDNQVKYIYLGGASLLDEGAEILISLGCGRSTISIWASKEAFENYYKLPILELPRELVLNKKLGV